MANIATDKFPNSEFDSFIPHDNRIQYLYI